VSGAARSAARDTSRSVWTALYARLVLQHGADDRERDLHDRTFAGREMYDRLCVAERERLRRRHRIAGEDLRRAVNWSDGSSGPFTRWRGRRLQGDALFVEPVTEPLVEEAERAVGLRS
jgi:hypothetical protein